MQITFVCKDSFYKSLCNIDEFVRQSPEWQHRTITSLDDVIRLVLDHGFRCFDFENPEFQMYDARLHGAEASVDDDGNFHIFYPEKDE
jgi:hypothetical protein